MRTVVLCWLVTRESSFDARHCFHAAYGSVDAGYGCDIEL